MPTITLRQLKKQLLEKPPIECDFKIGDKVTFTNEFGVSFKNHTIIGFDKDDSFYGRFIYIDTDSYWFPHKPNELTKEVS